MKKSGSKVIDFPVLTHEDEKSLSKNSRNMNAASTQVVLSRQIAKVRKSISPAQMKKMERVYHGSELRDVEQNPYSNYHNSTFSIRSSQQKNLLYANAPL